MNVDLATDNRFIQLWIKPRIFYSIAHNKLKKNNNNNTLLLKRCVICMSLQLKYSIIALYLHHVNSGSVLSMNDLFIGLWHLSESSHLFKLI